MLTGEYAKGGATVRELKHAIRDETGIAVEDQKLIFAARVLEDSDELYGVEGFAYRDSQVFLVVS